MSEKKVKIVLLTILIYFIVGITVAVVDVVTETEVHIVERCNNCSRLEDKVANLEATMKQAEKELETAPITIEYCGWEKDFEGDVSLTFKIKNNAKKKITQCGFEIAYLDANNNFLYDGFSGTFKTPYQQHSWSFGGLFDDYVGHNKTRTLTTYGFTNPNFNGELTFRSIYIVYEDGTIDFLDLMTTKYKNLFK